MREKIILGILLIFLIANISAICGDNQIDVNSASLEELDEIYGIGPAKSQAILDARPFENVDDLINVKGIGKITLENIKNQGLACVSFEENEELKREDEIQEEINDEEEIEEEIKEIDNENVKGEAPSGVPPDIKLGGKNVKRELIDLNPKDIKTDEDMKNLDKSNYAVYGFVTFCILLLFLFTVRLKSKKQFNKNEFR